MDFSRTCLLAKHNLTLLYHYFNQTALEYTIEIIFKKQQAMAEQGHPQSLSSKLNLDRMGWSAGSECGKNRVKQK